MQFATPADLLERLGAQDQPADPAGLLSAASALVARRTAGAVYATPDRWAVLQRNGMRADFSWGESGRRYAALYASLTERP